MSVTLEYSNKTYTFIMPVHEKKKFNPEEGIRSWEIPEQTLGEIPIKHIKISMGNFNAQLGQKRIYIETVAIF